MPTEEDIASYYEDMYTLSSPDRFLMEMRRVFRLPEQIRLIADILKLRSPPASILDIGCDQGFFLDEARRYGYQVCGVEPSLRAREYCQQIGLTVEPRLLDINASQDIVVMWHSLEHIIDPVELMRRIYDLLTPGGLIFIRVPDYRCHWRKLFKNKWVWFQPENHYFHYSSKALAQLLAQTGFELIHICEQKPNNLFTRRAYRLSVDVFKTYFQARRTLKNRAGRLYENLTGVEVYAAAMKKE